MIFSPTPLQGSYEITLTPHADNRGWFARFYCKDEFASIGHDKEWVQMNHSYTKSIGALRGMHFQNRPFREIKMVRCILGEVFDVIIDLRSDSPTFLQSYSTILSPERKNMVYIPEGFAHGFQTLKGDSELIYLHTESYRPGVEGGIRFDDPQINIHWPLPVTEISDRDQNHPHLDLNFKGI